LRPSSAAAVVACDIDLRVGGSWRYANKGNCDGHVNSGVEGGMQQALDRLEDLLVVTTS